MAVTGPRSAPVLGVVLAGGKARRMGGGDKCLKFLAGRPLLDHVIERARPQVSALIVNAGGDPARFSAWGLPVAADVIGGFAGPLAGILTGLEWASANMPDVRWVATFATDAPFLPEDLVGRLAEAVERQGADIACAASGGRVHPVFALWPLRLKDDLRRAMVGEDMRKVELWTARYRTARVDFSRRPFDPFFNINSPRELAAAERILGAG